MEFPCSIFRENSLKVLNSQANPANFRESQTQKRKKSLYFLYKREFGENGSGQADTAATFSRSGNFRVRCSVRITKERISRSKSGAAQRVEG